jgi:thiol-disulfide isomerase/thioredoxin
MHKHRLILFGIILFTALSCAGQAPDQPVIPFPFNMALLTPDSVAFRSTELLHKGKPTVLAFWLTTCMPCRMEFEAYKANLANWQKEVDFQLFGISIDFPQRFKQISTLARENKWPFPVYWDKTRAFTEILPGNLNGLPQVFLFDRTGSLVWRHKGYRPGDEAELWSKIQDLKGK